MKKNRTNSHFVFKFTTIFLWGVFLSFFGFGDFLTPQTAFAAPPTVVGAGAGVSGTTAVTPQLPAGIIANDILLLFVETANQAITVPTPNGGVWTEVSGSPQGTGTAGGAGATRLTVFWSRYNGTQGAPTTSDSGDHQYAQIVAFRGVITTGNPWDITAGGIRTPAATAVSIPGVTTTVTDTLVVLAVANDTDVNNTPQTSAWTNANLTGLAEVVNADNNTNSGRGGGFGVATGSKATVGATGNTTATLLTSSIQAMIAIALKPPPTLAIGATAGVQVASLNSGDTLQYANDQACTSTATCSAFTLVSSGGETLTSIKVSETGTTNATNNLANLALFYDTDGNFSNGVVGQYGSTVASLIGETATVSGSLALTAGATYYFYVRYDAINGANDPSGGETTDFQIALPSDVVTSATSIKSGAPVSLGGSTTIHPNATVVTYQVGGDGGRSGYLATISGYGFGIAPVLSRSNCIGTSNTGCIQFVVGGNATVLDGDVSAWANRSVSFTVSDTLASHGGVNSIQIIAGSQSDATPLTFYIYPDINQIITPLISNASREGENITLTNTVATASRFGSTQGTVDFVGSFGTVSATGIVSWSDSTIVVTVPLGIPDNIYLGDIRITRASDTKTELAYGSDSFQILPSISSNSPVTGLPGTRVKITGDHFCQGGTCPVSPNRSTVNNNVLFGTTQALDSEFVSTGGALCSGNAEAWTHDEICINVPAGTPIGSQPTKVISANPLYASNEVAFTVPSSTPNDPVLTPPKQYKTDGTTPIVHLNNTNETAVILKADISASIAIDMALQVEVDATGAPFDGLDIIQGTVGGGGACMACTTLSGAEVLVSGLSEGQKQWRARVINTVTLETSGWIYYVNPGDSEADFTIDTSGPIVTFPSGDTCAGSVSQLGTNSVQIDWSVSELATGQVEYSTDSALLGSQLFPAVPASLNTSHIVNLINLNSGTTYYYKVKSGDGSGNLTSRPSVFPYCSFTTNSNLTPAKTTKAYINGATGPVSGVETYYFTLNAPEQAPSVKNAYIEVVGIASGGTGTVAIQANGVAPRTFTVVAPSPTLYRLVYQITNPNSESNLNLEDLGACSNGNPSGTPPCNKLIVTPGVVDLYVLSAKIVTTYSYSP